VRSPLTAESESQNSFKFFIPVCLHDFYGTSADVQSGYAGRRKLKRTQVGQGCQCVFEGIDGNSEQHRFADYIRIARITIAINVATDSEAPLSVLPDHRQNGCARFAMKNRPRPEGRYANRTIDTLGPVRIPLLRGVRPGLIFKNGGALVKELP
jgi:hypothetical protein